RANLIHNIRNRIQPRAEVRADGCLLGRHGRFRRHGWLWDGSRALHCLTIAARIIRHKLSGWDRHTALPFRPALPPVGEPGKTPAWEPAHTPRYRAAARSCSPAHPLATPAY